jgi:hypothetical protein
MERELMAEEEQAAFEAEMAAAGITVENPEPNTATITLLAKRDADEERPT